MKQKLNSIKLLVCLTAFYMFQACHKGFLDEKPAKSLVVPQKIADFQGLLDNFSTVMNRSPGLHVAAGDEMFVEPKSLNQYQQEERDAYTWNLTAYPNNSSFDWSEPYKAIFYANVVLDGVETRGDNSQQWLELEAAAKFYRAWAMYGLVESFGDRYDPPRLRELQGIPIRIDPDIEIIKERASLHDTYRQIVDDLEFAKNNLPDRVEYANKPSKPAAFAILARIYLSTEEYESALANAESALSFNNSLLDYNTLTAAATRPFPLWDSDANPEIIFYSTILGQRFAIVATTYVDSVLIDDFHADDLRRACFFRDRGNNRYTYKGSYTGTGSLFGGLATDELYLICAESLIRLGRGGEAKRYLDELLSHRWVKGSYQPVQLNDAEALLRFTLQERRKQLFLRGLRWSDLKRLNKDPRFRITLEKRGAENQLLELAPDDDRYVFPIPGNELEYISR